MTTVSEYRYRIPPVLLYVGLGLIVCFILFFWAFVKGEAVWFRFVTFLFAVLSVFMGIGLIWAYFSDRKPGKLRLGKNFVEIVGVNETQLIQFDQVTKIAGLEVDSRAILLEAGENCILIEKSWMKPSDFEQVRHSLCEWEFG